MPDEPLIFIEVALTQGMPARVQPLLDPNAVVADPVHADCAVFYSITSCQEGLRGISFGSFLVKQVAEELGRDLPGLKTFATVSPVPGFADWLENGHALMMIDDHRGLMRRAVENLRGHPSMKPPPGPGIRKELTRLCAYYLLHAKRGKAPLDPVARFHLANGARLERINWMGDTSMSGLSRSLGFTVNYVYHLREVERNHEAYAKAFTIRATSELDRLARLNRPDGEDS